ncbi:MAG: RecX family transcriptional regulator [Prolixibacteraceae bacterium]|nr:RecX family transcriptional regulator [Prolixibacteraceae bacterium]
MQPETKKALSKCMALCSKSEKCISDIRNKLEKWQLPDGETQIIIDSLIDEKFIDEQRFAESFVRDKFRFNYWGKIKITYHLKAKGISSADIAHAMQEINEEEYFITLKELLTQKNKSVKAETDYERKAKLIRFAQGRGFDYDMINKALTLLQSSQTDD